MKKTKLALVTGGGVRVGAAICRALADAGYTLIVHANRSIQKAQQLAGQLGGVAIQGDLRSKAGVDQLFCEVDKVDGELMVLVNSAAIFESAEPHDVDSTIWENHIALNLSAPFWCAQSAYKRFGEAGGSIVNVIDIAALRPEPGYVHYSATKAGLIALTRGLAQSWAPAVRVNGVSPGPVLIPEHYDEAQRKGWIDNLPMRDKLGPTDVAETVRFLVDGPQGITGEIITVDGGWTTRV